MKTLRSSLALLAALVGAALVATVGAAAGTSAAAVAGPPSASTAVPGAPPTPGSVSVRDHGAGGGAPDDTAAFAAAMAAATRPGAVRFASGPAGASQGVVYVPAGTYRLLNLTFPSNLRMEVDAGAVLQQAGGRTAKAPAGYPPAPTLVLWDGPPAAPLRNVSLVGVGQATGGPKSLADPVAPGWSLATSFTFNLDPQATNANNLVSGLMAMNVDGFLVANVFSVQNDFLPAVTPTSDAGWWPSSRKAALSLRARSDSPADRSAFYDPHNGAIANWYNIGSPRGFGPNQVNSGHNLAFTHIFSRGGTALRFETDSSDQVTFGSEVRAVTAADIAGANCNRAVSFSPHAQTNVGVRVSKVRATACYQGVVEAVDQGLPTAARGAFLNSTVSDVIVTGGSGAQVPVLGSEGRWVKGPSSQAFGRDSVGSWAVTYAAAGVRCRGSFQWPSDPISTTAGMIQPVCTPLTANPTVPAAPAIGPATLRFADALVSFAPAASDGGSPITNYTVTSTPGGRSVTGTTSPLVVPGLTVGTSYTFTVYATNGVGNSPESSPSNAVTVVVDGPAVPDPPTGLTATALSSTRVALAWNWTERAKSYSLSRATAAGGPYTVIASQTEKRFVDKALRPATTYFYVVQAVGTSGPSPPSRPVSVTTPA